MCTLIFHSLISLTSACNQRNLKQNEKCYIKLFYFKTKMAPTITRCYVCVYFKTTKNLYLFVWFSFLSLNYEMFVQTDSFDFKQ